MSDGPSRSAHPHARRLAVAIHDARLAWRTGDGTASEPSPGVALLEDDGTLLTGHAAAERWRLAPRRAHHRFWHPLDDDTPLPAPFPSGWTAADLAHAHLESELAPALAPPAAGERPRAVLAVPGHPRQGSDEETESLALAAGIARAAGLDVVALVDSALAATADAVSRLAPGGSLPRPSRYPDEPHTLLHVDLHLHRTVLTELTLTATKDGATLERRACHELDGVGLLALHGAWVRWIAATCVRQTRFDPLHGAATEQELWLGLPDWLVELTERDRATVELRSRRRADACQEKLQLELRAGEAVAAAEPLYRRLEDFLMGWRADARHDVDEVPHLLAPTLAGLPGIPGLLRRLRLTPVWLEDGAPLRTALGLLPDEPPTGSIPHHTSLELPAPPWPSSRRAAAGSPRASRESAAASAHPSPPHLELFSTDRGTTLKARLVPAGKAEGAHEARPPAWHLDGQPLAADSDPLVLRPGQRLSLGTGAAGPQLLVLTPPEAARPEPDEAEGESAGDRTDDVRDDTASTTDEDPRGAP